MICFAKYVFVEYLTHYRGIIVTQNIGKINIKKGNFGGEPAKVKEDKRCIKEREKQVSRNIKKDIEKACGFSPDPSLFHHTNALGVLSATSTEFYFSSPQHLAFHDLTHGQCMTKMSKSRTWMPTWTDLNGTFILKCILRCTLWIINHPSFT